jgi:signal transduction histidine kinase
LKTVIYRVLQEAMNNVAKHSNADLVRIYLVKTDGTINFTIQDTGRGFDLEQERSAGNTRRGFGLASMRERTELAGGSLSIESGKGAGTIVRASWPW